jgi:ABC-type molybdate transport system substrate-binding protein
MPTPVSCYGTNIVNQFRQLGVYTVPVAEIVAKGEAEIGMQQINVILPVARADYVGPLPAELHGYVNFAVAVLAVSQQRHAAQALVKFMSSPEAAPHRQERHGAAAALTGSRARRISCAVLRTALMMFW